MGRGKEACVIYYDELFEYFDRSELTIIFFHKDYGEGEPYKLFKGAIIFWKAFNFVVWGGELGGEISKPKNKKALSKILKTLVL